MKNICKCLYTGSIIITFLSCKRENPDPWILPPNFFYYQIVQNGNKMPDSILSNLKFYYFNEMGNKVFSDPNTDNEAANHVLLPSWIPGNEALDAEGVRLCMEIASFGVRNNTWYFEYPNGDIDTLYIESQKISKQEGRVNECQCVNPITLVRYNGRDAYKHPSLKPSDKKPVFVLEKL